MDIYRTLYRAIAESKFFSKAQDTLVKIHYVLATRQFSTNFKILKLYRLCSLTTVELS